MKRPLTLHTGFWAIRIAVFVFVCVVTFEGSRSSTHRIFEGFVLVGCGVFLGMWALFDRNALRGRSSLNWQLALALGGLGFLGGMGSGVDEYTVSLAAVAAVGAGNDLLFVSASAVTAAGVLGIEISGAIFSVTTAAALGWPLLLLACLLLGRNRREVRLRVETSTALITQMEHAQEEQQRSAALDERNRIAREIHDVLAHSLSALGIQIEAARSVLRDNGDIEATLRLLDLAQQLADDGLLDSRRAIHALRSDTPPLPEGLASLVGNHELQHDGVIDFVITGEVRSLQPAASLALIRIADEALTNAAKHAPNNAIHLCLDYGENKTSLTVSNATASVDRKDVTESADSLGGYGLAGMRERLLLIGGTLTAGPFENAWTVRAQVPE